MTGSPFPVTEHVTVDATMSAAALSASAAGPIVFRTGAAGGQRQFVWFDRSGKEIAKVGDPDAANPLNPSLSPDGRFVVYRNIDPMTGYDIRVLPVDGDRQPSAVVQTHFEERDAQFSPDGQWIAYQSNESGRFEIYVQPFPGPGDKCQISVEGGTQARWRRDGEELFYIGLDGRLMATSLRLDPDSQYVDVDPPVALFPTRIGGAVQSNYRQQYAVSADGQRFLMNTVTQEAGAPITVILNWKARP